MKSRRKKLKEGINVVSTGTPPNYNFPSLDLVFELTKERLSEQLTQVDSLDTKANFVLGASTTLLGAALVLQAVILGLQNSPQPHQTVPLPSQSMLLPSYCLILTNRFLQSLPLLLLLLIYLAVLLVAFLAYNIRNYQQVPNPEELENHYLYEEEKITKAEVFTEMVEAFKENKKTIRKKVFWIKTSFILLGFEAIALVTVLLVQVTC